jgi:16S rRNA (uracil1498-N3)-methyltransferase
MPMPARTPNRLFHSTALVAGSTLRLDAQASHHVTRVLRLAAGEAIELFDGRGRRFPARLEDDDPRGTTVTVGVAVDAGTESPLAIGLAQALPAGDKMDWVVEKAVELGVAAIQPLFAQRSMLRLQGERAARRLAHWRRVAVAACMQCGRDIVPEIAAPMPLAGWLAAGGGRAAPRAGAAHGRPLQLVLSPRGDGGLAALPVPPPQGAWLLAGPESGLDDAEQAQALVAGWRPLRLGPRVLRSETAGLAALAALQARFGDF